MYYGTEMEKNQICRMKADGSGYEVLGWGQSPTIYKDRIYYIKNKVLNSKIIYNAGFQRSEVAGACDILESGGTTTKPSDLQITYPANHSSGKNPKDNSTTKNTNPTQNTSMIHTKEAIKQYLQGFSKHLSNQAKQQIPSVLKEIDSFTNANDMVQYTGAFKKEIQQFPE